MGVGPRFAAENDDEKEEVIHVISLGAGVQSSTMALMAAHGDITPMPLCAVFADTGWEPPGVMRWLDWLEKQLPFPVVRVVKYKDMGIREHTLRGVSNVQYRNGSGRTTLPFMVVKADGSLGMALRKCTKEFKIEPIEKYLREEVLGLAYRQRAPKDVRISQWRGISLDEVIRMKPSTQPWYETRYPLAMEHGMRRHDCLTWMRDHGYPEPPRSACVGCPFHSDHEWRDMKSSRPDEWADAVEFDHAIRYAAGMERPTYLHRQGVPLDEVNLDTAEDRGQASLFGNECEGMCGV